ncbi:hypothetical protein TNCV_1139871 [Trichonephila clavipes]|nr:hypothetical protein TNCV_1139871 [Trichonephila clavipes]
MHLNEWYTVYLELESTAKVLPLKPFLEDEMRNHVSQSMEWNQHMGIAQYPFKRSNAVMILALPIECMSSTASSIGKSSDTLSEFRALKSTQSRPVHLAKILLVESGISKTACSPVLKLFTAADWEMFVGRCISPAQDDLRIANDPRASLPYSNLNGDTPVVVFGTSRYASNRKGYCRSQLLGSS